MFMQTPPRRGLFFVGMNMFFRTSLPSYFCRRDRGWMLSLFVAVSLVYLPFLGNPFVFDDLNFFSGGEVLNHYAHLPFNFDLRWLPYASLGWTAAIFSDVVPHSFHLGNMLLHAGSVILLFYFLRQLVGAVLIGQEEPAVVIWGAWFGALVFACHPVAVYAVGYVMQRSILMAAFFALLMQWAYVRGLLSGQKRWLVLAAASYFAACFSKEHSVMTPAVLGALTFLLRSYIKLERRSLYVAWAAFAAIGSFVVLRAKGVFGTPYEAMAAQLFEQQGVVEATPVLHLLSALTQAGLFFKYLLLWALPNPAWMSVDMREPFVSSVTAWRGWLGLLGFVAYGVMGCRWLLCGGWLGLAGLALLYPWLQFVIEFSSIRVQEPFVLYRSYLWMPGMMLLFPILLAKLPERKVLLTLGCVVVMLLPLSWNRLWVFADNYRLWNDAAILLPNERVAGADRIFYNRGQALTAKKKWENAIADFQRVVALNSQLAPVHNELGMAYFNFGHYQEAIRQFDIAIVLEPKDGRLYYGKGLSLMGLRENAQAMQQMKRGCDLGNSLACMMAGLIARK